MELSANTHSNGENTVEFIWLLSLEMIVAAKFYAVTQPPRADQSHCFVSTLQTAFTGESYRLSKSCLEIRLNEHRAFFVRQRASLLPECDAVSSGSRRLPLRSDLTAPCGT